MLFIHGVWLTPAVWKPWQARYEALGYRTLAPTWPLLDRGPGAAVSIYPAPAAGIKPGPKAFLAALPVFLAWRGWSRALIMDFKGFALDVANSLGQRGQQEAFDAHVVPAPGRIYYQSVFGIGSSI